MPVLWENLHNFHQVRERLCRFFGESKKSAGTSREDAFFGRRRSDKMLITKSWEVEDENSGAE
ncbi:MAG: hypothetical protein LKE85_10700 [Lachnospiraceae bacterium]|jgi:hypothetical protein|nr:hypothetical protein [Lachnospiraceae bacterium]